MGCAYAIAHIISHNSHFNGTTISNFSTMSSIIIERLSDDKEYYGEYGQQFLSNSDISALINDPASFHKPSEDKIEFVFGKAFHELVMFGQSDLVEVVINASNRNTNIYKDAARERGEMLLLTKEYDQLMFIVEKVHNNKEVNELILGKNLKYEVPQVAELFSEEVMWKGKADIEGEDYLIDLKTTSNLSSFARSVKSYNYDSQAYIYSQLFKKPMKFIAIDKNTGVAGIFDVSPFTLNDGMEKAQLAEENFIKYFLRQSENTDHFTIYGTV